MNLQKPLLLPLIGLAGLLAALFAGCQSPPPPAPVPQLGAQAWTFRAYSFKQTVEKLDALGIRYLQAYSGQRFGDGLEPKFTHTMRPELQAEALAHLKKHNVTLASYGVVKAKTEADWRQIFAFATAMGLREITCEATPEFMPLVDRLCRETGVRASLHNHATPAIYADPAVALAAVAPYGPHFGLCADTGHWVRSGFKPVDALRKAEGRIISLHFKDLSGFAEKTARDVPWGTGVSDIAGQLAELRRQKFTGIVYLEYEHMSAELEADVALCADYFRRWLATAP